MEFIERVFTESTCLIESSRRGNPVCFEPLADAGKVVVIHEGKLLGLEEAAKVDGDDIVEFIVVSGEHLNGETAVVGVRGSLEIDIESIVVVCFHCLKDFSDSSAKE